VLERFQARFLHDIGRVNAALQPLVHAESHEAAQP
jgi:hypothetical protein